MAEKKKMNKSWYSLISPQMFGKAKIAETPSSNPETIYGRKVEVSMQELSGDFSKAHIKLIFKVDDISGLEAYTNFIGHTTTTDYVKRISKRHRAKIDGVFDVTTKDGKRIRVKLSAYALKKIQSSQKSAIRKIMREVVEAMAKTNNFDDFVKLMLDGGLSKEIYKLSKVIYPIKRIEIHKSELLEQLEVKIKEEESETEEIAEDTSDEKKSEGVEETVKEEESN